MQSWWKSYTRFSPAERKGISFLLCLLFLLVIANFSLKHLIEPELSEPAPELLAAYDSFKEKHRLNRENQFFEIENTANIHSELFYFDPNILDSAGFLKLGLRPQTVKMLLNWRRKGKVFYEKEDLRSLYTLKEEEYLLLEPFIVIRQTERPEYKNDFSYKKEPLPEFIDLNTADSSLLIRIKGIGPVLAGRIVEKRNALGGFVKHEQLYEVFRFPDTTFKMFRQKLIINENSVRRIRLNQAGMEELSAHPYIGENMAKNIILYREGLKTFTEIQQLRQVPLMNEENYRKIAPYFTLE